MRVRVRVRVEGEGEVLPYTWHCTNLEQRVPVAHALRIVDAALHSQHEPHLVRDRLGLGLGCVQYCPAAKLCTVRDECAEVPRRRERERNLLLSEKVPRHRRHLAATAASSAHTKGLPRLKY